MGGGLEERESRDAHESGLAMKLGSWKILPFLLTFLALTLGPLSAPAVKGKEASLVPPLNQAQGVPACKNRVNVPDAELHWLWVPDSAAELHTELPYVFLAGQLISHGAVDASSCPAGGLTLDGSANACGLALTKNTVISLQNAFDPAIMQAWVDYGVPPVLLKQLFRYESQFWPGTWGKFHFGLGHVTWFGAYTALTRNSALLSKVCATTGSCSTDANSPNFNAFLDMLDAYCPTCQNKVDMNKAQASVGLTAQVVYAYCEQASQLVFNATGLVSTAIIDYPTLWKLALMNYNAGAQCVFDAVNKAYQFTDSTVSWYDIEHFTTGDQCVRGVAYANRITEPFYNFPPK